MKKKAIISLVSSINSRNFGDRNGTLEDTQVAVIASSMNSLGISISTS